MPVWLIPDSDFDDPGAWEIVGTGGAVTAGTLKFTLANVIRAAPLPQIDSVPGVVYYYEIGVPSVTAFGFTGRALWGGEEIWNKDVDGAGTFTGLVTPTTTGGLVFQALPAQYTVDYVRIREATVTDIVNIHLSDVITRLNTIASIQARTVTLYTPDQIVKAVVDKFKYPAVGVIYSGMRGLNDGSKTGLKANLLVDIFVAGNDLCLDESPADLKPAVTAILQDIRNVMSCTVPNSAAHWQFLAEYPEQLNDREVIGYVQRWQANTAIVT